MGIWEYGNSEYVNMGICRFFMFRVMSADCSILWLLYSISSGALGKNP